MFLLISFIYTLSRARISVKDLRLVFTGDRNISHDKHMKNEHIYSCYELTRHKHKKKKVGPFSCDFVFFRINS